MLPAAEVTRVADDAFAACLAGAGFSMQKPRHWIRTSKEPIHELVQLHTGRIAYVLDWGVGSTFVPSFYHDGEHGWQAKRKRTKKSSQIDVLLGPLLRDRPDHQAFEAGRVQLADYVRLPNLPKYLANEAGIRTIVKNGCREAVVAFDRIREVRDVLGLMSPSYEASLHFPPKAMPMPWIAFGIYEIACGNEVRGMQLLEKIAKLADLNLADPILRESIAMARSHSREAVQ
jgi:hypothetical protein